MSGDASSTMQPSSSKRRAALVQISRISRSIAHLAVVVGGEGDALGRHRAAPRPSLKETAGASKVIGSCRQKPAMVSRNSARSATLRAIGPCTESGDQRLFDRAARHPPRRRAQADHRAIGAGPAQRAAMVGALRQPDLAGRQRHRAAAGRAAAGERGVPGIARAAEHLVEGAAAGAELRRVGLAPSRCRPCARCARPADAIWPARDRRRSASRRWCARRRRRSGP